ncbi:MAG TPA: hypothetical protein VFU12_20420 [Glycomyces sp.]|nr:hypothetical protein [Glycomyces sp.]
MPGTADFAQFADVTFVQGAGTGALDEAAATVEPLLADPAALGAAPAAAERDLLD